MLFDHGRGLFTANESRRAKKGLVWDTYTKPLNCILQLRIKYIISSLFPLLHHFGIDLWTELPGTAGAYIHLPSKPGSYVSEGHALETESEGTLECHKAFSGQYFLSPASVFKTIPRVKWK